jgi:adenosylhomocysteine nucleosidase
VPGKVAIVAALEREVAPLIRGWAKVHRPCDNRMYTFYESGNAVLVCGGIGSESARRASEAIIALFRPELVISAGFAGALDKGLSVGSVLRPARVVDARDGTVSELAGEGTLVTFVSVASAEQKTKLAYAYGAQAVDMEAAAVARGAEARGVRFAAVKAISDASGFQMPPLDKFVTHDGQLRSARFLGFVAIRPWLWANVIRLARNSSRAARALSAALGSLALQSETLESSATEWHPMKKAKI